MPERTESTVTGILGTARRWQRVRRAMRPEDQVYAERLAEMIERHAGDRLHPLQDSLEAAMFAVMIELLKDMERRSTA